MTLTTRSDVRHGICHGIVSVTFAAACISLLGCGGPSEGPPESAIIHVHEQVAAPYGNTLKNVHVEHLNCKPLGTAWGCSYDISGIEVFARGRGEKSFSRKGLTIKLERRGDLWDLAV